MDLLRKAVGWRIEYALLKTGALQEMTMAGIVRDDSVAQPRDGGRRPP